MRSLSVNIFGDLARENFSHADTDTLSAEETILSLCFAAFLNKQEASEGEAELHTKDLPKNRQFMSETTAFLPIVTR
jgi:hypothetical protein